MTSQPEFNARLQEIRQRIAEAVVRSKRQPGEVTLLAVTKTLPVETIRMAYEAGLRDFGENRVQESLEKIKNIPLDARWHLIGRLQTNKINKINHQFVLVHSVDSIHLAEAISARMGSENQDILLEVNTSGETSKAGVSPEEAVTTAEKVSQLPGLKLKGLMTVGPLTEDTGRQREAFKKLKGLFDEIRHASWAGPSFSILSMGMSGDFEVAIEEGSTLVRVGTALFGKRH
ncbi:MAG TPA: YggS family pyridoxal phosphate-dependent enzyme [bacterium]